MSAGNTAPLRVAVCGLGLVAQLVYLPLLTRRAGALEVAALVDVAPAQLQILGDRLGVPAGARHADVPALAAAGGVDAAIVLTSGSHGADVAALRAADIPVLVEKPLAFTLVEADALGDDPHVLVGYMKGFDPSVEEAGRLLDQVGTLRAVEVTVLHPSPARQIAHIGGSDLVGSSPPAAVVADLTSRAARCCELALGAAADALGATYRNIVLGSIVHDVALVRQLVGPIETVHAASHRQGPASSTEPGVSVSVDGATSSGAEVAIRWHLLADYPAYREQVRFHGEWGSVELEFPAPYLLHVPTALTATLADGPDTRTESKTSYAEAFDRQLTHFLAVVAGAEKPRAGIAQGRADIVTGQRIAAALAADMGVEIGGEAASA